MIYLTRKPNRLKNYDYTQNGAYFITLCVKNRLPILSHIATDHADNNHPTLPELSSIGQIVNQAINEIPLHYPNISIDHYVIMPNHIHFILRIDHEINNESQYTLLAPTVIIHKTTLSEIIRQMKGFVTKQCGMSIWQKSYYDHIIRDDNDYRVRWNYIDQNPIRWLEDEFYIAASNDIHF